MTVDRVEHDAANGPLARVRQGDRTGTVELALLRPALRGEHLAHPPANAPPRDAPAGEHLVWTHAPDGRPLPALPLHAARWLAPWRDRLTRRTDARGNSLWWALFRTDGAANDRPRVVWPDLARTPLPRVLPAGAPDIPLNSAYVARFADEVDAHTFAALLASPPAAAWLAALAEPARGGYRRYLAWTVGLLPIPADWERARSLLAPLGPDAPSDQLTHATAAAYGMSVAALAPLLVWSGLPVPPAPAPTPPTPPTAPRRIREPAWATRLRAPR